MHVHHQRSFVQVYDPALLHLLLHQVRGVLGENDVEMKSEHIEKEKGMKKFLITYQHLHDELLSMHG